MSMPNTNGTRQPHDSSCSVLSQVLRPKPKRDARNIDAPWVATCHEA